MMREYISREAAINKLLQCADDYDPDYSDITVAHAVSKIKEISAADVVDVVRCKDCKYRYDDDFCGGRGWPEQLVPDDGYCNNGAIKDGGV